MAASEGGWGWVVVFCCFYHHAFVGSAVYSLSVYYGSWVEDFNTGRGLTSWVLTMVMAVSMGSGPIIASLSSRFGNREVVMLGSILSTIGFFASSFVTSVYALIVLIGVIAGFGIGMQYLPSLALIPFYFNKKRSLAMGIAVCGAGVGVFLYPPFLIWLEQKFTWRGAMMIVSGISLNNLVCGALLRPVTSGEKSVDKTDQEREAGSGYEENLEEQEEEKVENLQAIRPEKSTKSLSNKEIDLELGQTETRTFPGVANGHLVSQPTFRINGLNTEHVINNQKAADSLKTHLSVCENPCNGYDFPETQVETNFYMGKVALQETQKFNSGATLAQSTNSVPSAKLHPDLGQQSERLGVYSKQNFLLNRHHPFHKTNDFSGSLRQLETMKHSEVFQKHKYSSANELHDSYRNTSIPVSRSHPVHTQGEISSHRPVNGRSYVDIVLSSSIVDLVKADSKRNGSESYLQNHKQGEAKNMLPITIQDSTQTSPYKRVPQTFVSTENCRSRCDENASNGIIQRPSLSITDERPKSTSCCPSPPDHLTGYLYIMKNPYFAIFAVSNFLTCFTYLMPVVYLVDRAVENGVEKSQAALAFSMYGAGNLFGRVALGWLADHFQDSLSLGASCLMVCGISTCLSPLCGASVVMHGLYGFTFGFFMGGYVTLTPIILVDLLGLSLVSRSYGLILVFQAMGFIAGTPMAGWIYDASSSYTISFIIHGAVVAVSALGTVSLKIAILRANGCSVAADDVVDHDSDNAAVPVEENYGDHRYAKVNGCEIDNAGLDGNTESYNLSLSDVNIPLHIKDNTFNTNMANGI